jgi:ABC-type branched-subunit amino acid transport system ATPase component
MSSPLCVNGLRKEFGGLVAVDDVSFEIGEGEFVGLIGPNGCGKSTTFNCISGLLEKTSGTIEIFGQDASQMRPDQIQKMGLTRTFQHTRLWREMTVIENLMVPPREQLGTSLLEMLKALIIKRKKPLRVTLSGKERTIIPGNTSEGERLMRAYEVLDQLEVPHMAHNLTSELSGGQSKLVDIGRSMMGEPRLLLLDEPVAGVAGPLAMKIFDNLRKLVDDTGISILIIEHNMDFILRQGVDRIIVMNEGGILMKGTPDEVRGNREVIEAYLGSSGEIGGEEE